MTREVGQVTAHLPGSTYNRVPPENGQGNSQCRQGMQLHIALVILETTEIFITVGEKHTQDAFGVEPYSCHFPERNFCPN